MPRPLLVLLAGTAVVAAVLAVSMSSGAETAREIVVEVRGMAFYVDGAATPNPAIRARPGELLRVTLRNSDAGLVHDFAVSDLGVVLQPIQTGASRVHRVQGASHSGHLRLRVPAARADDARPHRSHGPITRPPSQGGSSSDGHSPLKASSRCPQTQKLGGRDLEARSPPVCEQCE